MLVRSIVLVYTYVYLIHSLFFSSFIRILLTTYRYRVAIIDADAQKLRGLGRTTNNPNRIIHYCNTKIRGIVHMSKYNYTRMQEKLKVVDIARVTNCIFSHYFIMQSYSCTVIVHSLKL